MRTESARARSEPPGERPDASSGATAWLERSAGWIVGGAAVVAAVLLLHIARRSSFYFDEWWFIVRRRDASLDDFLRPWNGHLVAVPVALYNVLFRLVALGSYVPYRALLTAAHLLTCGLLFEYLRRRVTILYALAATIVVLFLGMAWEDLLWAFQITFICSLAAGVGALLLLDRRDRAGDLGAALAIAASIASAGLGLIFAGGILVELAWQRRDRRRLWIVLVPLALYALWYAGYATSTGTVANFEFFEPFTTTLVGQSVRALLGTPLGLGQVLLVAFYAVAIVQAVRTWPVSGRFVNTLAMPIAFWALVTYSRGFLPVGNRYLHPSAIFLALAGAEVLRTRAGSWSLPRPATIVLGPIALVVVAHTVWLNVDALGDGAANLRGYGTSDRARLSALSLASEQVDPHAIAFPARNPLRAGQVLEAIDDLDYRLLDAAELLRQPESARRTADGTLFDTLGGADTAPASPATGRDALDIDPVRSSVTSDGQCSTITPAAPDAHVTLSGDDVAVRVQAGESPVDITARSIAHGFHAIRALSFPPAATIEPGASRDLVLRPTGLRPWHLRLASDAAFQACALR